MSFAQRVQLVLILIVKDARALLHAPSALWALLGLFAILARLDMLLQHAQLVLQAIIWMLQDTVVSVR